MCGSTCPQNNSNNSKSNNNRSNNNSDLGIRAHSIAVDLWHLHTFKAALRSQSQSLPPKKIFIVVFVFVFVFILFIIFSCILKAVSQSLSQKMGLRLHCQRLFVQLLINIYLQVQRECNGKSNCHDKYDKQTNGRTTTSE